MPNNYNLIAPVYDFLKRIVFGNSLIKAECHFLKNIKADSSLLVVGSGTSEFLEHIDISLFSRIYCLDKSKKMCQITISRAFNLGFKDKIDVICEDFIDFKTSEKFDIVALPFLLDCQSEQDIPVILNKVEHLTKQRAHMIITDFYRESDNYLIKKVLIKLMYLFFRVSTNISRTSLPDFQLIIEKEKWSLENTFLNDQKTLFSLKLKKISI